MDEIGWMRYLKKGLSKIATFFVFFIAFCIIHDCIICIYNQEIERLGELFLGRIIFFICINACLGIIYGSAWIIYKLASVKIHIDFDRQYIREWANNYPPAIASLVCDLNTEVYRDYTSTILGLYTKKYINISNFNKEIIITKGINDNLSKLLKHEIYVYNSIINNESFEVERFKELIFNDAQEKGLVKEENEKISKLDLLYVGSGSVLGLSIVLLSISKSIVFAVFMIIVMCISIICMGIIPFVHSNLVKLDNKYKLTSKGRQELKKIKAFKNFIKDYTLIKEKDIEHIQILEEYIPYSLSLGMSPTVEEYIKENEIYRNLIYKGREKWI